jgi:parallel beta-helix repeat protein
MHPSRHSGHQPKSPASGATTIYVAPNGKMGARAGSTSSNPLDSLSAAVQRAKPGATIVLLPGTYTENVFINGKSNLTIMGAADQSSILAPAANDAIRVISSNNITIENVWFRSGGRGLAAVSSSVNIQNIKTDGTQGDGVLVTSAAGRPGVLNATSSQFNSVQTGSGLELDDGAVAMINGCSFNNNGTSPAATQASNGMVLFGGARANIMNSQFNGNTNAGLVAGDQTQVTVKGSTFSSNRKGDGALFMSQATVNLTDGNIFASNGQTRGEGVGGLNGVEFFINYTGTAVVSGNTFQDNTANGLYIGSAPNGIQIVNNVFSNNFVGIFLAASGGATIHATIQGNTIEIPAPTTDSSEKGIIAQGSAVTATIGGPGAQANTLENYAFSAAAPDNGAFIFESLNPNLTILGNTFTSGGSPVSQEDAIGIG